MRVNDPELPLSSLVDFVGGGTPSRRVTSYFEGSIPWITPKDMKVRRISTSLEKITQDALSNSAAKLIPPGSVLVVVRSGVLKHTLPIALTEVPVCINQDLKALICSDAINPQYLSHFLRWSAPEILSWVRATTADNIPVERLKEFLIPLPPLEEQKRIAGIMEESDALLKMRKQSITLVSDLPLALFNRFFGREGTYANTLEMHPLRDLVTIRSGGTPSKSKPEFWNGDIPWVSPKDMKPREIWDSEDHITELSTTQAALKLVPPESVLIVVRGMILVHTVPIRLTRRPVTINQDMKALIPREGVDPLFLRWALESIHSDLLASVSTASHGTKRLETDTLLRFALPVPPICAQREFATAAAKVEHLRSNLDLSQQSLLSLFDGLQSELFNGEDSVSQVMREAPIHV